jgi:hypothetical protein
MLDYRTSRKREAPVRSIATVLFVSILPALAAGNGELQKAWELERKGDAAGALELLQQEANAPAATPESLSALAEFLDVHHDPGARRAYRNALRLADESEKRAILRRLVILDTLAGDGAAEAADLREYRAAGGDDLEAPGKQPGAPRVPMGMITLPGPLRSFARMAALSPDVRSETLLVALARNVVTNGYEAVNSNEALAQTEYLKLVIRYLSQARELDALAGPKKEIVIETCDSAATGDLLRVLGYRIRGACGGELALETVNASRAFLTDDSGFPLAALEVALRTNRPFRYAYGSTQIPVLYGADYWMPGGEKQNGPFIDYFLSDPSLCRLYLGMAKLDPYTAEQMRKAIALPRLRAYAHVIDFFGGMFLIRDGKVVVPGGARSEKMWGELAGTPVTNPTGFLDKLISRDDGWLASYFDSLARAEEPVQNYLTEPARLKRFYEAIRGKVTSPGPARPVFRANTEMLLLTSRLWILPSGRPFIPGDMNVWRELFIHHPRGKYDNKLSKAASAWREPDDVLEALFGLCRKSVENEPLKIFLALTEMERQRKTRLAVKTVDDLARDYHDLGAQYSILAEAPELSDATIESFLDMAESMEAIRDAGLRSDAGGTVQGLMGLWQIFLRQGSLPAGAADKTLAGILKPFADISSESDVFAAGKAGVELLLANIPGGGKGLAQDRMVDVLAGGAAGGADADVQTAMQENLIRVFEAQKLIPLDTLFTVEAGLEGLKQGKKVDTAAIAKVQSRIAEIPLPRAMLSSTEKTTLAFGYWSERHIENERKVNLRAIIERAGEGKKGEDPQALLAPFLRDTLVGLNYAYYAPPGAQLLLTNPAFVRSHDFVGLQGVSALWKMTEVQGSGWPTSAGGKLLGSLAGLPYSLAQAEQNFLVPTRQQALIWGDLVPEILIGATVPRWWRVTPLQMHWVSVHMEYGATLLAEASLNAGRRKAVLEELRKYAPPVRVAAIEADLEEGNVRGALEQTMPSEMYFMADDLSTEKAGGGEMLAEEIRREAAEAPEELSREAISRAFGTPKPTLANSFEPQLLGLRTFPALMGYSSRILAESWESSRLYYAALGDDLHLRPAQLNVLAPEWTQATVEHIFATHLEDWPALLRSLRTVGAEALAQADKGRTATSAGGY